MRSAASATSAVSSTMPATLPAPTPKAGVPLAYAARTFACEPVATTRSHSFISSAVDCLLTGDGSSCTRSRGAPMRSNCAWMNSIRRAQVPQPFGEGATITALRPLSALMILLAGVAPGFVDGVIAQTTPTGRAISIKPRTGSSPITPTESAPRRSRSRPKVLRWFLRTLSSTLPMPVSATASSASSRLRPGSRMAQPAATTAMSTCACDQVS